MLIHFDEQGQFVTLIAHASSTALQNLRLPDRGGNKFVITNTQHETSTAISNALFNLIIVDLDLNGLGLVSLAKTASCMNRQTPIIALTEKADSNQKRELIAAGFDDCLLKPLTAGNLEEMIHFWREHDALTSSLNSIQALLGKCNHNHSLVLTLCKKLFEELPLQIRCIEEALKNRHYQLAFDATHKLNGSVKVCCLQDLEESATALEKCLIQEKYAYAEGYFLMLRQRIAVFLNQRDAILAHLDRKPNPLDG